MAVGLIAATAVSMLAPLRGGGAGTTFTALTVQAIKLHTADPGASAATAPSANTTRVALTMGAPTGTGPVTMSLTNSPTWASWASGSETISHISVWDATTAGNPNYTAALTTAKAVANGDTLTQTSLSLSLSPIAA